MIKIIKKTFPYYVMQDDTMINQFCVMLVTGAGFSQQVSNWYFRKGNAIKKYNQLLQNYINNQGVNHISPLDIQIGEEI